MGTATSYALKDRDSIPGKGNIFLFPKLRDRLWGPPSKREKSENIHLYRTIQLWNQLLADALGTLSCKPSNFRKRARKVINEGK
jgi:hypothetical protein